MTEASGRTARQDEVRQERRRRDDTTLDVGQARKLAIPRHIAAQLAEQERMPRWVNVELNQKGEEVGTRMVELTQYDDWDRVEGVEPKTVKIGKSGEYANAYLLSKPKEFIAEDRRKKDVVRRQMEDGMLKGAIPNAGSGDTPATALPENFYADPANKLERANQLI